MLEMIQGPRRLVPSAVRHYDICKYLNVFYKTVVSNVLSRDDSIGRINVGNGLEEYLLMSICDGEGGNGHWRIVN